MATKRQIEAKRRNARRSTGPRTEVGKVRASRNALRHGLTSRQVVLADEDGEAYEELRRDLHAELRPESEIERLLVNRIAAQQWRLARVPALETALFERLRRDALGQDEGLGAAWTRDGSTTGALVRLNRYEGALERNLLRLLGELRREQGERRRNEASEAPDSAGGDGWLRPEAAWPGAPAPRPPAGRLGRLGRPASPDAHEPPAAKPNGFPGPNGHGPNGHGPNGHGNGSGGPLN